MMYGEQDCNLVERSANGPRFDQKRGKVKTQGPVFSKVDTDLRRQPCAAPLPSAPAPAAPH
eukprot:1899841-Rhodomonas_salina.1